MPINTTTARGLSQYLTNFSVELAQSDAVFRAASILPTVGVRKQSDMFRVYNANNLREVAMRPLADGTQTAAGDVDWSEGFYYTRVWGLHVDYGPQTKANADDDLQLGRMAVDYLTSQYMLLQEKEWYDKLFREGVWSTNLQGGTDFGYFDDAGTDVISTIRSRITRQQILSGGIRPNTLVMTRLVAEALMEHPDIIDRINRGQSTGPAVADEATLAAILGLQRVVILEAVTGELDSETGETTNVMLGGDNMLLMYLDPRATTRSRTAAARFDWTGLSNYMTVGQTVRTIELDPVIEGTTRYEIKAAFDFQVVAPDLGTFFQNVLTPAQG